jgi:hypothetical protein
MRAAVALLVLVAAATVAPDAAAEPSRTSWAYLLRDVAARERPSFRARTLTVVPTATPEGESNLVTVLAHHRDASLTEWVRVRLAMLPNGRTGWVPRTALGELRVVGTRLVVDRRRLEAILYRGGRPVFRAPVGVGATSTPTPAGTFYVRVRLDGFGDPFYGPIAFGTNARSPRVTDWPGGGFVGIHGTNRPELLPGRVSHGCIRLRNPDIARLARLMPLGTTVVVR